MDVESVKRADSVPQREVPGVALTLGCSTFLAVYDHLPLSMLQRPHKTVSG